MAAAKISHDTIQDKINKVIEAPSISMTLEICDFINRVPEFNAPFVIKQLTLFLKSKNLKSRLHVLALFETCTNTCGIKFITLLLANKDLLKSVKKLAEGSNHLTSSFLGRGQKLHSNTPDKLQIRDQSLVLILLWGTISQKQYEPQRTNLLPFIETLEKFKKNGVNFPSPRSEDLISKIEKTRTYIRRGSVRIRVPITILEDIESCKEVVSVVHNLLEKYPRGSPSTDIANDIILQGHIENLNKQRDKLGELINDICRSCAGDEQLVAALGVLHSRMTKLFERYKRRLRGCGDYSLAHSFSELSTSCSTRELESISNDQEQKGKSKSLAHSRSFPSYHTSQRQLASKPSSLSSSSPAVMKSSSGWSLGIKEKGKSFENVTSPKTVRGGGSELVQTEGEYYLIDAPVSPTLLGMRLLEKLTFISDESPELLTPRPSFR